MEDQTAIEIPEEPETLALVLPKHVDHSFGSNWGVEVVSTAVSTLVHARLSIDQRALRAARCFASGHSLTRAPPVDSHRAHLTSIAKASNPMRQGYSKGLRRCIDERRNEV
jgi:hypothetical protein